MAESGHADDVITVYRRMEAACAGARAERDIMRAAVEAIAAGTVDPVHVAQRALDEDHVRRTENLARLNGQHGREDPS